MPILVRHNLGSDSSEYCECTGLYLKTICIIYYNFEFCNKIFKIMIAAHGQHARYSHLSIKNHQVSVGDGEWPHAVGGELR